ncbi:hypothetical protein [Streptomyces sp. NBC_01429]|uniref:hypothetical protein n=1 Tax=Streptomyces sp. NBC_01429 TaxID=2903862 RepID=UPI002E2A8B06|nr:hypothetical protein [Streptomyces sp. NBC_01429]
MNRRGGRGRARMRAAGASAMCLAAVVCGPAVLPGQAWAADGPSAYAFEPGAERITGATTTSGARPLDAGATYRDSIKPGGKLIYRLDLDEAKTSTYVSAVAVPKPDAAVDSTDRIKVSLQNSEGYDCSSNEARFGVGNEFPRPLAAYAYRTADRSVYSCKDPGRYYLVVERLGDSPATSDPWGLEIRHVSEPGLAKAGPTKAPSAWPSASPAPARSGGTEERTGGSSFYDAKGLVGGEWTTEIEPGASLFYRIPVDWGQQVFVGADLSSSEQPDGERVNGAFAMALYNPARGLVGSSNSISYDGKQKTATIAPLPPVAYENRFGYSGGDRDMRFAGWYYLRVSLNPEVGTAFGEKPLPLTLRVNVEGEPKEGPAYAGPAGDFSVSPADRDLAEGGQSRVDEADSGATMKLVAAAGFGTGTVLLLGLGAWTLIARRNAGRGAAGGGPGDGSGGVPTAAAVPAQSQALPQPTQSTQQYGPPTNW